MIRNNCVICQNTYFNNVFNVLSTTDIVSSSIFLQNEIKTLNFIGCLKCGCIQLQNLFDPKEIYAQPMQCFNGPSLNKHYELLCDFIITNKMTDSYSFFEVGGSYGRLAKLIINYYKDNNVNNYTNFNYQILEFNIEYYPSIENVEYISGNCESYEFKNTKTLIMSHVFEHLYDPRLFLKKISDADVKEIFISIPDMESLTKIGDINNLNIYHTFYIDTKFITYLFQEYGYELKNMYNYVNNSIFYYFVKEENLENLENLITSSPLNIDNTLLLITQKEFYENMKQNINNIVINMPFYICPSGLYGRFIYYYLNDNTKNNVLGFLDSDTMKINKRLCGTNCLTYKKDELIKLNNPNVLIVSKKHNDELTNELLSYNNNTKFYYL